MKDLTIIGISSNTENPDFEQKIRDELLKVVGDHRLISVTQKPVSWGENICVGEVGASYRNAYIQLLIGAREAKTKYISIAEADQLYPPGYFDYEPEPLKPDESLYMCSNLWVLRKFNVDHFARKGFGDWCIYVDKEFFISQLLKYLHNDESWGTGKIRSTVRKLKWQWFDTGLPVITVKTENNISKNTGVTGEFVRELPHWGRARDLSRYLGLY